MKYLVASDLHGSAYWCEKVLEKFEASEAEKTILLGDILYHGPRNDLPKDYNPKKVIEMLNKYKDRIFAVRGNCESEVDQMVLEFPVMAEYAIFDIHGQNIFATHGHKFNEDNLPPITNGDAIMHGHTHILRADKVEKDGKTFFILNPGSTSIPKGGNPKSYAILDDSVFTVYDFDGNVLAETDIKL